MIDQHHDLVVIGGSAGAIEAIRTIVGGLPADLPAAVLIVIHIPPLADSHLPEIITRSGHLPASHARDGETLQIGHIYIAPPDQHLLVRTGRIELSHGPRVNHSRPAIDTLFRSAARTYGPRVIGVLLSGALYDGTAGLVVIKDYGGLALVQDPDEAVVPSMPRSALSLVEVDAVLPSTQIGAELERAVYSPARRREGAAMVSDEERIGKIIARDIHEQAAGGRIDQETVYTCPECGGVMWQADPTEGGLFHCHIGHVYAPEALLSQKSEELEAALWTCVRLLRDQATLTRQAAKRSFSDKRGQVGERLEERAQMAERQAQIIRELLESGAIRADSPPEPVPD